MKSTLHLNPGRLRPKRTQGSICLELTDPITGLTKHKIQGKNHIFEESLFSAGWANALNAMPLLLTNSIYPVDVDFPYIPGNIIGYGIPSNGSSGIYRGAYSVANQVLGAKTMSSIRWVYQYEFSTGQANGVIGTIGLSSQLTASPIRENADAFTSLAADYNKNSWTSDGTYAYSCSAAGVITKHNLMAGTSVTIDASSIVGATGNKRVGFAPATGRYYIFNDTSKVLYEFSSNAFTTLLSSYPVSNISQSNMPLYIYGNFMFSFASAAVYKSNFVANTAPVNLGAARNDLAAGTNLVLNANTYAHDKFVVCGGTGYYNSPYSYTGQGLLLNMSNDEYYPLGGPNSYYGSSAAGGLAYHPFYPHKVPFYLFSPMKMNGAVAQYELPTPVTKTSANGMIATYEVEVFWE